ncbi:MAG TPA: L-aspartate oxidase [Terracidiphilus sp.]|nr:L-aspartate oxidase [Terracidiphilus sp.]
METGSEVDFLVMGAGVAGLRAAVELAFHGNVLVVTKEALGESNTHYAQGGIAVAMEGERDIALHLEDTVQAGDGIVYRPAAEALAEEGPQRVAELIEWGAQFDQADGKLLRTREGAHSLARILHANGDATGAEIGRSLAAFARAQERIRFAEWTRVAGLVIEEGRVIGADLAEACPTGANCSQQRIHARAVLIASGGAGQVYSDTTNPAVATGDGIALAAEVGAELADMEFYQFHPTALSLPGAPRFLLSEALRGEGAYLRNDRGERFMERYHPLLELAPRDVVARAIAREGMDADGGARPVYLDMRHLLDLNIAQRFPGISAFLGHHGLDLARDLVPVRPAAHYLMGGIRTDLEGRTNIAGLYAAGEAACTGVHGANRLASNSLLEGLVFGARAARAMLADAPPLKEADTNVPVPEPLSDSEGKQVETAITRIRDAMWLYAGLLREEQTLRQGLTAQAACDAALTEIGHRNKTSRRLSEAQALSRVAHAILHSALARTESRGAHFRNDFPQHDDREFRKHSTLRSNGEVVFETW